MRLLILFSAWLPDDSENARQWGNHYLGLLGSEYADCDKIVGINHGCAPWFAAACAALPNVLHLEQVSGEMHINSDAAGYQACLRHAAGRLGDYDMVLFLHTKGASKPFESLEGLRWYFGGRLLTREVARRSHEAVPHGVHTVHLHPTAFRQNFRKFRRQLGTWAPTARPIMLNVSFTIYYVSSSLLRQGLAVLPESFLRNNLSGEFDRFLFELTFPSLLLSLGGDLNVLGEHNYNDNVSRHMAYNYDMFHNTEMVLAYWNDYRSNIDFDQPVYPMVFGPIDEVRHISANFSW
jgi:hypothetical protein